MIFSSAYSPTRAFGAAWRLLRAAPAPLLVGGLVLFALENEFFVDFSAAEEASEQRFEGPFGYLGYRVPSLSPANWNILGWSASSVFWLLACWIRIGLAGATESAVSLGHAKLPQVFDARGRWVHMVLASLLQGAVVLLALAPFGIWVGMLMVASDFAPSEEWRALFGVPSLLGGMLYLPVWLYVALGVSLTGEAVAIEGLGPVQALARSWNLARGNRMMLLAYLLVLMLIVVMGMCVFVVGMIVAKVLASIAHNESYLRLVRSDEEQREWEMDASA